MEKMQEMFSLQAKLNNDTNGPDWIKGFTNKGKKINWLRCIRQESAELIDSFPWKHWKAIDAKADIDNAKIELVDIWHFIMSESIRHNSEYDISLEELISNVNDIQKYWFSKEDKEYSLEDILVQVEQLIEATFNTEMEYLYEDFFALCKMIDLQPDELYSLYIGKNALNIFRQTHGYKEGSYIKIWNGKEDNVVMQEILENNQGITFQGLLNKLEENYPKGE